MPIKTKQERSEYNRQYHLANRDEILRRTKKYRQDHKDEYVARRQAKRKLVLDKYGGKCYCCGETILEFLGIDHIGGGGNAHRREIRQQIYHWLIKQGFPDGFGVLCHNCNMAKSFYGKCPHEHNK